MSSAPVAVNWLTYEEHIRLADKLFRLHRTLRSLYRERSEAPLPTALKQAAELVGALQAGLNSDSLRHGAFPLLCTDSSTDLSDQLVEDALEIDRLVEAKPPCHCIISTAHKLLIAVTRVQLLLCSNKAIPPFLLGVPRTPPPRAKAFPHRAEYQRVAEYLAALNVHLEVLVNRHRGCPDASMPRECRKRLLKLSATRRVCRSRFAPLWNRPPSTTSPGVSCWYSRSTLRCSSSAPLVTTNSTSGAWTRSGETSRGAARLTRKPPLSRRWFPSHAPYRQFSLGAPRAHAFPVRSERWSRRWRRSAAWPRSRRPTKSTK